jgi:hypothetical protein
MPQTGPPFSVSRPRPWQASAGFAHEMVVPPHSTHGVGSMLVFAQNSQRHEMRKLDTTCAAANGPGHVGVNIVFGGGSLW